MSELGKIELTASKSCKFQVWYDGLIGKASGRHIPSCYTEIHHIVPASLGGTNHPDNLVRLTYREHFVAHWLLTKIYSGAALRKMQRALFAMTLKCSGERIVSGWQFEVAKRAVRDLELDPEADRLWRIRFKEARLTEKAARFTRHQERKQNAKDQAAVKAADLLNRANLSLSEMAKLSAVLVQANKDIRPKYYPGTRKRFPKERSVR